jgi:hypothetical protein
MALARRPVLWLDAVVKASLVGLLTVAVARQDLPQFAGKAVTGRAIGYPLRRSSCPRRGGSSRGGIASSTRERSTSSSSCRS